MATVIFSNAGDTDTAVLRYIWNGIPNVKVLEINKDTLNAQALVDQAIEEEHDTLICCGHGSDKGLFNPAGTGYSFAINRQNYKKIKVNRFIGVWCHASEFGEAVHLKGFYSSMFISNKTEASTNQCYNATASQITTYEIMFCTALNLLIRNYVPMKKWVNILNNGGSAGDMPIQPADKTIDVVKFNYDGLKYLTKFEGTVPEYNEYGYAATSYNYGYGSTYSGNWRKGHWDYALNRYVYDDEVESTAGGKTSVGESVKAAKTASKRKTKKHIEDDDWDDDDWYSRY